MSPLVDLVIRTPFAGAEEKFNEAVAVREQREQHWAGRAGLGGNVRPASTITFEEAASRVAQGIFDGGGSPEDLDRAASLMMARSGGDALMARFAGALRRTSQEAREAAVVYGSWLDEKEMARMNAMTESLIDGQSEQYLREQRTQIGNAGSRQQYPARTAPLAYPLNTTPTAEDIDPDRAARGATQPPMSQALRSLAQEVAGLARLSSNARQKARLLRRAEELSKMSVTQYRRETESEVALADDPDEPNNVMSKLASDMDAEARAAGAQDDDSFASFNDWDKKPGADEQIDDDVQDQRAELDLGEDVPTMPRVPAPGKRIDEDRFGDKADVADEPRGASRAKYDDDVLQRVRRGTARFGAGQPRGGDRYGHRVRYSGLKRESMRESRGDWTQFIIDELAIADFAAHSHF